MSAAVKPSKREADRNADGEDILDALLETALKQAVDGLNPYDRRRVVERLTSLLPSCDRAPDGTCMRPRCVEARTDLESAESTLSDVRDAVSA